MTGPRQPWPRAEGGGSGQVGLGGPRMPQWVLKLQLGVTARGVPAGVCHRLCHGRNLALQPGTPGLGWGRQCWVIGNLGAGGKWRPRALAGVEAGPGSGATGAELSRAAQGASWRWRRRRWTQGQGGASL